MQLESALARRFARLVCFSNYDETQVSAVIAINTFHAAMRCAFCVRCLCLYACGRFGDECVFYILYHLQRGDRNSVFIVVTATERSPWTHR